jgi:hypothetical protein
MKRHVAAVVALLTTLLVLDSHVDKVQLDGRPLLEINGQQWDLHGWASEQMRRARRDCASVTTWPADSPSTRAVLSVIQQHSPPDSLSARWLQWLQMGNWGVAELEFDTLKPTLVVLRLQDGLWRVQDQAVWSGSTAPWHSGDFVRRYLRQQAPDLPQDLLDCLSIDPVRYGAGPGGLGPVPPSEGRR